MVSLTSRVEHERVLIKSRPSVKRLSRNLLKK
jgi:hypothetical protein